MAEARTHFGEVPDLLKGSDKGSKSKSKSWDAIIAAQIQKLARRYESTDGQRSTISTVLAKWHQNVTLDYKHNNNFTPHVNGFYMIFMVHGPWYAQYQSYVETEGNKAGLSKMPKGAAFDHGQTQGQTMGTINLENPNSHLNMLATDIDVPDITEEYISVSSRIRNSFVPSRNYFVSDFTISYIENINLDIIRYHEAWHKYMNLIKRGEVDVYSTLECQEKSTRTYFLDIPYSNSVWVAVFRPFTTEIQLLIKLTGVMPVNMPLKQVVGNRSASKMTVLNMQYKAADIFYKFYNSTTEFAKDDGLLAKAFRTEVLKLDKVETSQVMDDYLNTPDIGTGEGYDAAGQ